MSEVIERMLFDEKYEVIWDKSGYIKQVIGESFDYSEFSHGSKSGFIYMVNNEMPPVSATQYTLKDGDVLEFLYIDEYK